VQAQKTGQPRGLLILLVKMVLFFLASLSSTEGKAKKKRKQRVFALVPLPPEVPYEVISSLYGLLSSAGASLQLGPK